MWNEKKETYLQKSAIIKNVQEYFHSSLKMGKSLCTEAFGVEPDVKTCNSWNEEDIPTRIHCLPTGHSTDSCSSSDKKSYTDSDTAITNEEVIEAIKSAKLKYCVAKELASRAKTELHSIVNSLNATKSVLLLLSNSSYKESEEEKSSARRVDALLNAHGLQPVAMLKDGDCLFSAVAFQLKNRYSMEGIASLLNQHLRLLGIEADKTDVKTIGQTLRELTVKEFLDVHRDEYASYLDLTHREHFEDMANKFVNRGFFDCELGNATPLALANVLQVPSVIMPSTENFPVISVIPRETLTNAPMYITYQRIGAGHYDATIETHQEPIALLSSAVTTPTTPGLVEDHLLSENVHNQLAAVGCRCGRGNAKNKQERTFCRVYKDGCKCFQTIKGCTSTCGCFNCGNPYGERPVTQTVISEPVPRKRRRHFPKEVLRGSEQEFMESSGIGVIPPP